jgi:phenylpropionate dioxygenase-like ring-hydroxylating dioxygenase large terminal subunit
MSKPQATLVKALSAAAYIDAEVYRQEQNKIFARSWQFACHVEKLLCSGDFVVCEVAAIQQLWRNAMGDTYE